MDWLNALHANYKAWVATQAIDLSDGSYDYRIPPGATMDFVSYTALPFRLFDDDEVQAIFQYLVDGPQQEADRAIRRYVSHVVTARFANLANRALQDDVEIISIGADCLPRILFSKWGLQRTRMFGKLSYPFDLALAQPKAALRLVAEDFAGLLDPAALAMLGEYHFPFNHQLGTIFNHEAGEDWGKDNFARLTGLYARRIRDYRNALANPRRKLFLCNYCDLFNGDAQHFFTQCGICHHQPFDAEAKALLTDASAALATRTIGPIGILCVVTGYAGPGAPVARIDEFSVGDAFVRVIHVPRPTAEYTFYDPAHYSADSGLAFERSIVAALGDLAQAILPAMPPISAGVEIARC